MITIPAGTIKEGDTIEITFSMRTNNYTVKNKMMELTDHIETQEPIITRTILTCYVRMNKNTILETLMAESILINGKYYKVPERFLLLCLIEKRYGELKMDLEEII